jgi:hypothetical protein
MDYLRQYYGSCEGPLGFPMQDRQATVVDTLLKSLPKGKEFEYRRLSGDKLAATETSPGERSDVSWITTESPDRQNEVVIAKGMNDSQFVLNPIVTLNHCYHMPPVGKSLWRKRAKDGTLVGIKAKTQYPPAPANWPEGEEWPPDCAFSLVQADLLRGKSIGFLPTAVHVPTDAERRAKSGEARAGSGLSTLGSGPSGDWSKVDLVIDEWILLEYACVFLPAQQNAVVENVSKALPGIPKNFVKALGLQGVGTGVRGQGSGISEEGIAFTSLSELENCIARRIAHWQPDIEHVIQEVLDRHRGRV